MHFFKLNAWLCEDCSQSYNSTDNYANVLWINRKTAVVENTFSNLNAIVSIKIEKTACSFFLHFWIKLLNKRWDEQRKAIFYDKWMKKLKMKWAIQKFNEKSTHKKNLCRQNKSIIRKWGFSFIRCHLFSSMDNLTVLIMEH